MKFIEINSASKSYGGQPVLVDFSLEIDRGERIVILGPSGCGKTTVLRLLAGFVVPDTGSIIMDGEQVATEGKMIKGPEQRDLGMVFQDLALWPHLTVRGNLEFGLKAKGVVKEQRGKLVREILGLVQLNEFINAKPGELSGGQQQRVALARSLVLHPKALLMESRFRALTWSLTSASARKSSGFKRPSASP